MNSWGGLVVQRDAASLAILRGPWVQPQHAADIWVGNVANGDSDYRFLRYANKVFTSNDSSTLAWQRKDDNWWVNVNGKEFYFIPGALNFGGYASSFAFRIEPGATGC